MRANFFDEMTPRSAIKVAIVVEYFKAWAGILSRQHSGDLWYIDLFSGPGRYNDNSPSTPVRIVTAALADASLREQMNFVFNDADAQKTTSLLECLSELPGFDQIRSRCYLHSFVVGSDTADQLAKRSPSPSLMFVDPFHFRGLTMALLAAQLRHWGCDCLFFLNYSRIVRQRDQQEYEADLLALLGPEGLRLLREPGVEPRQREAAVLETLRNGLAECGAKFMVAFRFTGADSIGTSHFLVFASKHKLGYHKIKSIMYKHSTTRDTGVAALEYSGPEARCPRLVDVGEFDIQTLARTLADAFAGEQLTAKAVFDPHNHGLPYSWEHYQQALTLLRQDGRITTSVRGKPHSRSIGEKTDVMFVSKPS